MDNQPKLTANQIVAFNLFKARRLRGWTQEQAAKELEPYLGELWAKATWSFAERSVSNNRIRHFSADEIVAFSRCFDLPVGWFLLPPDQGAFLLVPDENGGLSTGEQIEVVFGTEAGQVDFGRRVKHIIELLPPSLRTRAQSAVGRQARVVEREIVGSVVGDLERTRAGLLELAGLLEEAQDQTFKKLDPA